MLGNFVKHVMFESNQYSSGKSTAISKASGLYCWFHNRTVVTNITILIAQQLGTRRNRVVSYTWDFFHAAHTLVNNLRDSFRPTFPKIRLVLRLLLCYCCHVTSVEQSLIIRDPPVHLSPENADMIDSLFESVTGKL